jgi:hypothetical protein
VDASKFFSPEMTAEANCGKTFFGSFKVGLHCCASQRKACQNLRSEVERRGNLKPLMDRRLTHRGEMRDNSTATNCGVICEITANNRMMKTSTARQT